MGSYSTYTDHEAVSGVERMNQVYVNGTVAANYTYTWNWADSSGSTKNGNWAGNFTWSSTIFYYVRGTDNQTGYSNPTVWFYMDNTTQNGATFYLLDTPMTVKSTSYSYFLPSQNRSVHAIQAEGAGNYMRDDSYGRFNAAYTWTTYFDPWTGYIIGYVWNEQDTDSSGNGFTYTETLYVTTTSYQLTTAPPPPQPSFLSQYFTLIIGLVLLFGFILIIVVAAYAISKRRKSLPRHVPPAFRPPPTIDLTPKEQPPVQQIVIKEVVKVKCRYCGALIDSTVEKCPFCGAPRT